MGRRNSSKEREKLPCERLHLARWVYFAATALFVGLTGTALRRATARAEAAAGALAETNDCLVRVLESTTDGVQLADAEGRLTFMNRRAREMLSRYGINPDSRIGKPVLEEVCPEVSDSEWGEAFKRALLDRVFVEVDIYYAPWRRWYSSRFYPTRHGGVAIFFRDVTTQKEGERALANAKGELERRVREHTQQLQKRIGELQELSYSIVHDLRAPLRTMHTCAHYLADEYASQLGGTAKDYARRIMEGADRMDKLLLDVLTYSGTIGARLELKRVDTDKLVRSILESYPQFQGGRTDVTVEGELPPVQANEALLTQIISSILDNAIKFVNPGVHPRVRIRAEQYPEDGFVRLWFEDNGIGIEKEYQERIFEMFQRLDKNFPGTGAGLAVARKAIERMGGHIGVESKPGTGSRFWVELRGIHGGSEIENWVCIVSDSEEAIS